MKEKIKILTSSGIIITLEAWQKLYGLPTTGVQVGKYFSPETDTKLKLDIYDFKELIVAEPLMRLMDAFRARVGKSVKINAFNRTGEYQRKLKLQGYRAALHSPHVEKMAVDIDTTSNEQSKEWAKIMREVSKSIGIKCRIGYKQYLADGLTFIHVDVCPEYFAVGKPMHDKAHPVVWEQEITW